MDNRRDYPPAAGKSLAAVAVTIALSFCCGMMPLMAGEDERAREETTAPSAYLFAHMMKNDYGRLYYSISRDGLHWKLLNNGERITDDYRGHPDICKGHDGRYYLIGNWERRPAINLWVSDDLINWSKFNSFRPDVTKTPDFKTEIRYHGAPKLYYDTPSSRYIITWHTPNKRGDPKKPEKFWSSMKTLYATSKELAHFSHPRRLFRFDMATIDVIIRREGERYYAFIKDERYPSFQWPTGKTIRISSASSATGPWSEPSPPITTNFREAPTLIPRPDGNGWYLYYEQYPGVAYGLSTAPDIDGPWYERYCRNFNVPAGARHGCMIAISQEQYSAVLSAFGSE